MVKVKQGKSYTKIGIKRGNFYKKKMRRSPDERHKFTHRTSLIHIDIHRDLSQSEDNKCVNEEDLCDC